MVSPPFAVGTDLAKEDPDLNGWRDAVCTSRVAKSFEREHGDEDMVQTTITLMINGSEVGKNENENRGENKHKSDSARLKKDIDPHVCVHIE